MWVKVADMQFEVSSAAARWALSVDRQLKRVGWVEFGAMIMDRFGRDQQELLIRQLFHIKQTSSVSEYIGRFSELVDQLIAYGHTTDPLYYSSRFVDGLRDDIRAMVLVQRPPSLDTACTLALLQEEVADLPRRRDYQRTDHYPSRSSPRSTFPLPASPHIDKPPGSSTAAAEPVNPGISGKPPSDKFASLRSYRRARGLCDRFVEKWHHSHKCSPTVQLNVIQEVFDLFADEDYMGGDPPSTMGNDSLSQNHLFLALSNDVVTGTAGPRTMKLVGSIQGHQMSILVDSGSSHTFISQRLAALLDGVVPLSDAVRVQIANGAFLQCGSHIPGGSWLVQQYSFVSDIKVIPLEHYDFIIGMDWIEEFSPMKVHWRSKWMAIPYQGSTVVLQGFTHDDPEEIVVQVRMISYGQKEKSVAPDLPPEIADVLSDFKSVFAPIDSMPPPRTYGHSIPLVAGAKPVFIRPYRYPPSLKDEIEKQIQEMLDKGIIRPSNSPFSSPLLLVKKKDGSWCPCVDYRHPNALTIRGQFPIPIFDELVDEFSGACWFSTLDLNSGFHQIRMKSGEEFKTASQTHFGHFEFLVMPFGLCGPPGTFQGAMNTTLKPLLRRCVLVFFDDILVYSKTFHEHVEHLRAVLQLLFDDKWQVKFSKCSFAQRQISYLGHVVSVEGISTDNSKISAITSSPVPSNAKELCSFLGLARYYRKFVKHFAVLAKPLTSLLKNHTIFVWTPDHQAALEALKSALVSAPVLAAPDFSKQFSIETDACAYGIGVVLLQDGHPLAYISRPLGPKSAGLSTYEEEHLAILMAVEQWRSYLQHGQFTIFTDQRSLVHLTDQRLNTPWQHKVFTKLTGLQYHIVYKAGSSNQVADALSQRPPEVSQLSALSVCAPSWTADIIQDYSKDSVTQDILAKLSVAKEVVPHFTLSDELLTFENRVWIGYNPLLQLQTLAALHATPVGGHSGFPVTYRRIKQLFAWKNMKQAIKDYVSQCQVCQQAKPDRSKYAGLLQPLPVPTAAWQMVTMDFFEGLPRSHNKNSIMVVVDKLTKYSHFIPLAHPFTAGMVAKAFFDNIYKLHGLHDSIISDRDKIFTSNLWRELFKMLKVSLSMSSSYHPQSDGQTERMNQCMETFLRCYVHACPSKWLDWLRHAEYWYNTSTHSAIGCSPFEALYGYSPKSLGISPSSHCHSPDVANWREDKNLMTDLLRQHLHRAQQRMKFQAHKNRQEQTFHVTP
jgi:hypothetical protein